MAKLKKNKKINTKPVMKVKLINKPNPQRSNFKKKGHFSNTSKQHASKRSRHLTNISPKIVANKPETQRFLQQQKQNPQQNQHGSSSEARKHYQNAPKTQKTEQH